MTRTLSLDQVELSFDPSTANIELTSADPRLAGNRLKLTVSTQTSSYQSLLKLLVDEGYADPYTVELPRETLRIESARELKIPGKDPRSNLAIGIGMGNRRIHLDLSHNVLIAGGTGSGKSIAIRNVLCHGLEQDDVELWAIDLKRVELGGYAYREQDIVVHRQDEALQMLQTLHRKLLARYEHLDSIGAKSYLDGDFRTVYLIIDELGDLIRPIDGEDLESKLWNAKSLLITQLLTQIARIGRGGGLHLICGIHGVGFLPPELRIQFFDRILMGRSDSVEAKLLFGRPNAYGGAYLEPRGRGVLAYGAEQELFQAYFIPYEAYRAPRDA